MEWRRGDKGSAVEQGSQPGCVPSDASYDLRKRGKNLRSRNGRGDCCGEADRRRSYTKGNISVKETIQAETDAVVRPLAPTQSEPEVETAAPSKAPAGTTEADEIQIIPLG